MSTTLAATAAAVPPIQPCDAEAILERLAPWLDDLAARIDPADEDRRFAEWARYARSACPEAVFRPRRRTPRPPRIAWPQIHINDAVCDPERMVLHQLRGVSDQLAGDGGLVLCVRCNYGTPILASVLGVTARLSDRGMGTLPGSLPRGTAAVRGLVEHGPPPAAATGLMPLVLAMGRVFRRVLASRPGLDRIHLYHPDFQGPLDILELLWGSDCFVGFHDDPGFAQAALAAITEAYLDAWRAWCTVQPPRDDGLAVHWGLVHRGQVMLRDDSAMNLSPAMVRRLVAPVDARILAEAGGGAIHACGRVDHWLPEVAGIAGLSAVNLGQPAMNDPRRIWAASVERGIALTPVPAAYLDRAVAQDRKPRGLVAVV